MAAPSSDVWEVMSTARTIRRFTDEPVDDATVTRCLEAATNYTTVQVNSRPSCSRVPDQLGVLRRRTTAARRGNGTR